MYAAHIPYYGLKDEAETLETSSVYPSSMKWGSFSRLLFCSPKSLKQIKILEESKLHLYSTKDPIVHIQSNGCSKIHKKKTLEKKCRSPIENIFPHYHYYYYFSKSFKMIFLFIRRCSSGKS